ncbi:MAG TPA: metallophosphoesterase [Gemmataceae bacterium]|nr:metallophosphoesterase [Gemmataceae bacterium]
MASAIEEPIRLVHLSDIHLTNKPLGWTKRDFVNKRVPGWLNFRFLGRGRRFLNAETVLSSLIRSLQAEPPHRIVFSGDATALGFENELMRAAHVFGLTNGQALKGLAVPGNHDYYTQRARASGAFERLFASWQEGERVDEAVYPFAQRVGPVWLVAVNSSVPNRMFWNASGQVESTQLDRLERLFQRLSPGPRILVTHYPVCLANGRREMRHHGLRNLDALIEVANRGKICLWLHGHRHGFYRHQDTGLAGFPVICAGSATQVGKWSYGEYVIVKQKLHAIIMTYDPKAGHFKEQETFDLTLPNYSE